MGQIYEDLIQHDQKALEMVTVQVKHAVYKREIAVQVSSSAILFDVRKAVAAAGNAIQLQDVILVERSGDNFGQLSDFVKLGSRRELLALGCNLVFPFDDEEDLASATDMSTLALMKVGRAVGYSGGRAVEDGEAIRVEAECLQSGSWFCIQLISRDGDTLLRWQADAEKQQVVRTSCIRGSWGRPRVKEIAGDWPHGKTHDPITIDFVRSPVKWKVRVNGIRLPIFDFAHRSLACVTEVKMSDNLVNAKAILVLREDSEILTTSAVERVTSMRRVHVTHAVYGRSIDVMVPEDATYLDVRKKILKKTGASRIEEVLLVHRVGRTCRKLPDEDYVDDTSNLLALGCNSTFILGVDAMMRKNTRWFEPALSSTEELLELCQAVEFPAGREVCVGDTIRVQADGWLGERASQRSYNTFFINLKSSSGDIVLHWGARQDQNHVVRNSWVDGEWDGPVEETVGGWPHGNSKDLFVTDFTRAAFNWKIHVNGVRLPDFDFAHRMSDMVTNVQVSDNLRNAKVFLIPSADCDLLPERCITMAPDATTSKLVKNGFATDFRPGLAVQNGETVRVEAQWWDKAYAEAEQTYNSFFIDLKSCSGDILFHWGARPDLQQVARNSMIRGRWGHQEVDGAWPHWHRSGNFFGDNVWVDFKRTDEKWIVSVNGQRLPQFDFVHRSRADATGVEVSDSLCNVKVSLIRAEAVRDSAIVKETVKLNLEKSNGVQEQEVELEIQPPSFDSDVMADPVSSMTLNQQTSALPRLLGNSPTSKSPATSGGSPMYVKVGVSPMSESIAGCSGVEAELKFERVTSDTSDDDSEIFWSCNDWSDTDCNTPWAKL